MLIVLKKHLCEYSIYEAPKKHITYYLSHMNIIPIVSVRTIFGQPHTSDNFWTKIVLDIGWTQTTFFLKLAPLVTDLG